MKKPDDDTLRMLEDELNKIIAEVNGNDTSVAEQVQVTFLIMEITANTTGVPSRVRRRAHEVLYRYFSMIEGLERK